MADATETRAPEIVDQVVEIAIADIEVGERLRPVDLVFAAALGQIMSIEGQKDPIKVCRLPGRTTYHLVAGGHRLEGGRIEGWRKIKAIVVSHDALQRRLTEVSENLWRKGLSPLDRAAFVAELITLKKVAAGYDPTKDGRSISAIARWQKALKEQAADANVTMTFAYGFTAEAAELLGVGTNTIQRDLLLHRRLLPDVAEQLRALPIGSNAGQLRALAKLDEDAQRKAAGLIAGGKAKGAAEAVAILQNRPKSTPEAQRLSAFIGAFSRMATTGGERLQAMHELQKLKLPRGVRIVFDGDKE